ncbi:rbcG, partial [Symbiodinium sp. CCMP2456]
DDDFVAPHPDEEHLDVPSTETTKLHQECEDPDESGSECSDDEASEASAYEVGDSDEEADKVETVNVTSTVDDPDCDGGPDPANLEPPATAQQSASLPEFFDIGSMDDSAPEADEPREPKAKAAQSAEAAAAEAKAAEAAAAQAAAELEEAAAAEDAGSVEGQEPANATVPALPTLPLSGEAPKTLSSHSAAPSSGLAEFFEIGSAAGESEEDARETEMASPARSTKEIGWRVVEEDDREADLSSSDTPQEAGRPDGDIPNGESAQQEDSAIMERKASDHYSVYGDLYFDEDNLIRNGNHVLVGYIMKPKEGYGYLETATRFASESCASTPDDFDSLDVHVYYINPDSFKMKLAYPLQLFGHDTSITCSFLNLDIRRNQRTEEAEYIRINDFYLPPRFLRLYDGPALNIEGAWRVLGQRRIKVAYQSGAVADSGMKSQLGLKPGHPCSEYWQGDLQNSLLGQTECLPEVLESIQEAMKKPGPGKVVADSDLMIDRGKFLASQFKALCRSFAVLAESYVAEKAATTDSDQSQCGYTAFVHATISQVIATMRSITESNIFESISADEADEADDAGNDALEVTSEQLGLVSDTAEAEDAYDVSRVCRDEATLIKNGQHVLVNFKMKANAGCDYLATAMRFAAESAKHCTGSNDALVYDVDPGSEEVKIAYPTALFDCSLSDGRDTLRSFLNLAIGNTLGVEDVEFGKIYDFYLPPSFLRLQDSPSVNTMWRILDKGASSGGLGAGAVKPKLGMQPKPFRGASYAVWQGGIYTKTEKSQGNQAFGQMNEGIPEVVIAMRSCIQATGVRKMFSGNNYADDPNEMIARGKYILSQFGPFSKTCVSLVAGYAVRGSAQHTFPKQFLHYHRAGQASTSSPQTQRGYSAFVHTQISQVSSTTSIHVGTSSFGKTQGDSPDKIIAVMLQDDAGENTCLYYQEWESMKQNVPIIAGSMTVLRLPAVFQNLGHSNVILTAAGSFFSHKDGSASGAIACRQVEEAWKAWRSGQYGSVSLSDGVVEFAKTHEEIKGAFLTFPKDADEIYPGWKEKLGCTGVASVPAAIFVPTKISTASFAAAASTGTSKDPTKMVSQGPTGGPAVNPYTGGVKSIPAASSNTARTLLGAGSTLPDAVLQDSPKKDLDARTVFQNAPQESERANSDKNFTETGRSVLETAAATSTAARIPAEAMREQTCGPSPESSPSSSASRSRAKGSPLAPALRDATRPKPRKTLSFSEQVEHRSISPNPRPGDDRQFASTARSSGKSAPMQSSSLPDLFAYGTGLGDFREVAGMPPDDKNDGSANKKEEFGSDGAAAEAAQQEPFWTRDTRLAHEKMPEPEEEPAEATVAEDATAGRALEQSSRYADLTLDEATLVKNGEHVLVAYIMKPKTGYDYLSTAAHFAAESCTG